MNTESGVDPLVKAALNLDLVRAFIAEDKAALFQRRSSGQKKKWANPFIRAKIIAGIVLAAAGKYIGNKNPCYGKFGPAHPAFGCTANRGKPSTMAPHLRQLLNERVRGENSNKAVITEVEAWAIKCDLRDSPKSVLISEIADYWTKRKGRNMRMVVHHLNHGSWRHIDKEPLIYPIRKPLTRIERGRRFLPRGLTSKGKKLSAETRHKLSLARKGKKLSDEHCHKISLALTGKKASAETRQKISLAHMGKKGYSPSAEGRELLREKIKQFYKTPRGRELAEQSRQRFIKFRRYGAEHQNSFTTAEEAWAIKLELRGSPDSMAEIIRRWTERKGRNMENVVYNCSQGAYRSADKEALTYPIRSKSQNRPVSELTRRRLSTSKKGIPNLALSRFTAADIPEIFRLRASGVMVKTIAEQFGVDRHTISAILHGRTRTHLYRQIIANTPDSQQESVTVRVLGGSPSGVDVVNPKKSPPRATNLTTGTTTLMITTRKLGQECNPDQKITRGRGQISHGQHF
jgi:hypothetical protein